jgi:hypothetical protein
MKFEKLMKKFCKDIGVDKKTLLTMMLGNQGGRDLESSNAKTDPVHSNKESGANSTVKDSGIINTGVAAQLAYNNIIPQAEIEPTNTSGSGFMKLRNGIKSRNANYSLSENRDPHNQASSSFVS